LTVDIDLLKFSEQYRTDEQAISLYRKCKIKPLKTSIQKDNKKLKDLGKGFLEQPFRISAHRALTLNSDLSPIKYEDAKTRFSNDSSKFKDNKPITGIQDDFDALITTLYSEEADIGARFLQDTRKENDVSIPPATSLSKLVSYWNIIMPHRQIELDALKITIKSPNTKEQNNNNYNPSEMSDGERNIFYILGQCLLSPKNSFLIVDEPELHINKSIMVKLWTHIQSQRKDCFFLFISHDIEFVNSIYCDKYVIKEYQHPNKWGLDKINEKSDIPENIKILIYGSRQPILFVEGKTKSLDKAVYEKVYSHYRVIPVESCELVRKYTASFISNESFHHLKCYGIIDRDNLDENEIEKLSKKNIYALSVSSIENLFLIPSVFKYMCEDNSNQENDIQKKVFSFVKEQTHKDNYILNAMKSKISKECQKIVSESKKVIDLKQGIENIDIDKFKKELENSLNEIIKTENYLELLKIFRNKGLYKTVLKKLLNAADIDKRIVDLLKDDNLIEVLKKELPDISSI
jgi:hypothetical protein